MELENIVNIIQNGGLAIVIAIYLIFWITKKLDKKLDMLIDSINRLNINIEKLINHVAERN
jgi:hypothetical protein